MKRITAFALITLGGILSCGGALAQDHAVQANVPFDFTIGNKLLPPGTYTIAPISEDVIAIQNRDRHVSILSTTSPDSRQAGNRGELVFDEYAGQYFLRGVLCESASLNVDLPRSKSEERVSRQEARVQNANQVLVAVK